MAITYGAVTKANSPAAKVTSIDVADPAIAEPGITASTLLQLTVSCRGNASPNTPTGWTLQAGPVRSGTLDANCTEAVYTRFGNSGPFSVTFNTGTRGNVSVLPVFGLDTTTPLDATPTTVVDATADLNRDGPSITTVTGTGVNEPEGILTNKAASVTTVAGATTSLGNSAQAQDLLIDLETALEESYLPDASYVMRRTTLSVIRKVRDADGRPIWQPSLQAGIPATINGYGVTTDPAMPAMAAGAKSIVFGDLRQAYVWRNVSGIAVRRLNERYAEFDQVGFLGFSRADGQVQNSQAYVIAANAAA